MAEQPDHDEAADAEGRAIAYFMRHGLSAIPFWQFLGWVMMLQLIWLNELLDFAALFMGKDAAPPNMIRGCLLSAAVLVLLIVSVGHSLVLQQRVVRGLLTVCSYCHKIRLNQTAWEQIEAYISRHSEIRFSHGICPECYEKATAELDAELAAAKRPGDQSPDG